MFMYKNINNQYFLVKSSNIKCILPLHLSLSSANQYFCSLYCRLIAPYSSSHYHIRLRTVRSRLKKGNCVALQVKTERLTPDNNSTSSRSVTPSSSSHPGTPPNATPLGGPEGPPPPHHLKHMEQMMGRNYSDFMRSLAAKYNNANPNEYVYLTLFITLHLLRQLYFSY